MAMRQSIVFYLNGNRVEVSGSKAKMMLADYLRYERALTGTKIVCAEGDCGACSVLKWDPVSNKFLAVNSCILIVAQLDGCVVVTVDALAEAGLTEVQKAMIDCHGSQCGFCTPGFVVTLTGLVETKICSKQKSISEKDAKNALTGNLCRCTGYTSIIDAAKKITVDKNKSLTSKYITKAVQSDLSKLRKLPIYIDDDSFSFFAPTDLKSAAKHFKKYPDAKLLAGGTDLGVAANKGKLQLNAVISLHLLKDLYSLKKTGREVSIGARVTLAELREFLKTALPEFANYLDIFASPQIKNSATLVGNLVNASPIGDTPPALFALKAKIDVVGPVKKRTIKIDDFILGYRKTALKPGELVSRIRFELPSKNADVRFFKTSQRKDLDISIVNLALVIERDRRRIVTDCRIAVGGVAATTLRLKNLESALIGNKITQVEIDNALSELQKSINPISDLRGTSLYRRTILGNLLKRGLEASL